MKLVPLTQGKFAMVDDEDYERVMQFKWCAHKVRKKFYAVRNTEGNTEALHVFLMRPPEGAEVHHRDEDGLNDQKTNLQILSRAEHERADGNLQRNNRSGYCGVHWVASRAFWLASINHNRKHRFVGYFKSAVEAALARDAEARALGWPESGMNFPEL